MQHQGSSTAATTAGSTEVLDDNIWERRCAAREMAARLKDGSLRKDLEDDAGPETKEPMDLTGPPEAEVGPQLPARPAASSSGVECGLDDESDDDDVVGDNTAGPLAAEGNEPELPPAPSERTKPKALDLELDMFGNPEEDLFEPID